MQYIFIIFDLLIVAFCTACSSSQTNAAELSENSRKDSARVNCHIMAEKIKNKCPVLTDYGLCLLNCYIEKDAFVLEVEAENNVIYFDSIKNNNKVLKELALSFMLPDAKSQLNYQAFADSEFSMKYILKEKQTNEQISTTIESNELKEFINRPRSVSERAQEILKMQANMANAHCPFVANELINGLRVKYDGVTFCYEYIFKENDEFSFTNIRFYEYMKKEMKKNTLQELENAVKSEDHTTISFIENCVDADALVIYRYIGSESHKVIDVHFTRKELSPILLLTI